MSSTIGTNIPNRKEVSLTIYYNKQKLNTQYKADFICYDNVIVELKALTETSGTEEAQVINYLKATGHERALLINFGKPTLQYKRLVLSNNTQ